MKLNTLILGTILALSFSCSSDESITNSVNPIAVPFAGVTSIILNDFINSTNENTSNGVSLGTVMATITNGTASYRLSNIVPNGSIAINSDTGLIRVADSNFLDFEINETITATVTVTSNSVSETANVTINLVDVFNSDEDLQAIVRIYNSNQTNSLGWDILQSDLTQYNGITIVNNRVTEVNIGNKGLDRINNEDLRNLTKLEKLFVENNSISGDLDFSNNSNLNHLSMFSNNITGINVSQNPLISSLLITGNDLTELDLSSITSLTDFKAHTNNLTSLNIANGNNSNMTRMEIQSNNLTCIKVDVGGTNGYNGWIKDPSASYNTVCP